APALAREVRAESGNMLLYTPVVGAEDFDVAVGYLFRRLDENASPGNFLRSLFNLQPGSAVFETEAERFRRSAADRDVVSSTPRRRQARPAAAARARSGPDTAFDNEPDTDPALASNRAWAARVLAEPPSPPRTPVETRRQAVDEALDRVRRAQVDWSRRSAAERRDVLYAVADELARRRGELVSAMVHEANKTFAQADPEVSEAIDFARYYGLAATGLEDPTLLAEDVRFEPFGVVGVVPPWNFPVAIPAGGVLAALAAGNGVVVKPAPETPRCAELVVECCHAAGVPRDLLVCLRVPEDETGRHLVTSVDALILTGSIDTAQLFQSWRPDLRLFAETSGKNALVVTPHADLDLAVRDLVQSAFGHSGQKCSAASLAICVGPVYASPRFRRQLVDAVESLSIGSTREPGTSMGPTIGPASERLRRGLTQLDAGERWLVEPRCLGPRDGGELWTPGVRLGVAPDSWLHRTECFGPVLGLIPARDLDHAIRIQNAGAFGLTGGLHSLDPEEIETWIERVEVGNAYVNRPITGAIVRRQPFGGWKRSAVGPGAKAGGPNYVRQLGTWRPTRALDPARAEASDRRWWQTHFGVAHDPTGLAAESNVFRYRPIAGMLIRALPDADEGALERVRSAARTCGVEVVESRAGAESDEALAARLTTLDVARIRVVGPATDGRAVVSPVLRRAAVLAGIHVADEPVTASGRIELLHGLREQAVSRTLHRFGNPSLFAGARGAAAAPAGGAGRGG
ncbi:MAG TPA: aldehyde dehydrogenase family protein, partial [Myxococcota bacterium]|nr:aldehyde dehydrogenase family protein [Myxococcota bacterium]